MPEILVLDSEDSVEDKVQIILKRIEISEGYEKYRKEMIIKGSGRPPFLISTTTILNEQKHLQQYKTLSKCNTQKRLSTFNYSSFVKPKEEVEDLSEFKKEL